MAAFQYFKEGNKESLKSEFPDIRLSSKFMQQHLKKREWYEIIDIHWLRLYADSDYNNITCMNSIRKNYTLPDWF